MEPINLELRDFISSLDEISFNNLKSKLQEKIPNINIRYDNNLVSISNSFSRKMKNLSNLEKECRSVILDKENLDIICYSYDDIYYNQDAKEYILNNGLENYEIQESFEGTLISIYYHEDRWNVSTRQYIDSKKSYWTSHKSYFDLFLECIKIDFDKFTSYLKKENNYFFILIHHDNKHIVDYSNYFNDKEYKEIVHVMTRCKKTHKDYDVDDKEQWNSEPNFRYPKRFINEEKEVKYVSNLINNESDLTINKMNKLYDFDVLDAINKKTKLELPVECEGFLVKIHDKNNKLVILKFQTNSYQLMSALKPNNNNIYMSFVELYQQDMLKKYLNYFPENTKLNNNNISYDTIGIIDATFKVLTSELYELFKHLYDLRDCSHKNNKIYKLLPNEYTIALYKIRGIYYTNKEKFINNKNIDKGQYFYYSIKIVDIYDLLKKNYDIKDLLKLLKARKTLLCTYNSDDEFSKTFNNFSSKCDKISIKMIAILLNKMFPHEPFLEISDSISI